MADAVSITSPDHARTYAYGAVTWHQLYLERNRDQLAARITFSNWPYADANEPRTDEPFDFRFPGIHVDFAQHAFVATGRRGEFIPVAWFRGDASCGWIKLAPNAKILSAQRERSRDCDVSGDELPAWRSALDRVGQQFFVTESFDCAPRRTRSAAGRLMRSKFATLPLKI